MPRSSKMSEMVSPGGDTQSGLKVWSVMVVPDLYDSHLCNLRPVDDAVRPGGRLVRRLEDKPTAAIEVQSELTRSVTLEGMRPACDQLHDVGDSLEVGEPCLELLRVKRAEPPLRQALSRAELPKVIVCEEDNHSRPPS